MIHAWLLAREETHIDPRYLVFLGKDDALTVANAMAQYWYAEYGCEPDAIDETLYGDQIYHYAFANGYFSISVTPLKIRGVGEVENTDVASR